MRDLLELAIDKGVRNFIKRAMGAGLKLYSEEMPLSDAEYFNKQLEDFIGKNK